MSTLAGPLGSCQNFVDMIVLPNCIDYFDEVKALEEGKSDKSKRALVRRLFNAVVALDSAVDHLFFEQQAEASVDELLKSLATTEPAIQEIRELCNAMKHCIRGNMKKNVFQPATGKTNARDIAPPRSSATVERHPDGEIKLIHIKLSWKLIEGAHESVEAAFRHWLDWSQKQPAKTKPKA